MNGALFVFEGIENYSQTARAGPSRCGAQCKTSARDPMQNLGAGPL